MILSTISIAADYWPLILGLALLLTVMFLYLRKKMIQTREKQKELIEKIAALEEKIAKQSAEIPTGKKSEIRLVKEEIEKAIDTKLGASSWDILNLLIENPSTSNKEIAEKVSLSVEGVSSSLRRMYVSFGVKTANNKRIALVMKALELSEVPIDKEQS
ncbi:AsnC family protein [Lewinella sp. LCG006]|uniref:AsnC family protein n=1 Tax=Lewinella sp. LCG006 TaxID=3231911 RepID=UPI0034614EB8